MLLDTVRLTYQETDRAVLDNDSLDRNILFARISDLDGKMGDIALPPSLSLEQTMFLSAPTSVCIYMYMYVYA